MTTGTSMFLIAIGAILKYAVTAKVDGIDLHNAGVILMVVGFVGLAVTLLLVIRSRWLRIPPPGAP